MVFVAMLIHAFSLATQKGRMKLSGLFKANTVVFGVLLIFPFTRPTDNWMVDVWGISTGALMLSTGVEIVWVIAHLLSDPRKGK
ncbi:MAG: hypothetical protein AAF066_02190 [Pseudomonadota bacterium]